MFLLQDAWTGDLVVVKHSHQNVNKIVDINWALVNIIK
jgi:hypothetical protein